MGKKKQQTTNRKTARKPKLKPGCVSLSDPMPPHANVRDALLAEKDRTGVGPAALLGGAEDAPPDLSVRMIHAWLGGHVKTARRDHIEYALSRWRSQRDSVWVPVTPQIHRALLDHKVRTGTGTMKLLSQAANVPEGLSAGTINNWIDGAAKSAIKEHLDFVLAAYAALPDGLPKTAITASLRRKLRALQASTGLGPSALLRGRKDILAGLSSGQIRGWTTGKIGTARADHLDCVLKLWREVDPVVPITESTRQRLLAEKKRTGLGSLALLRRDPDAPDGLTPAMLDTWLRGSVDRARRSHLEYILRRWKELPDGASVAKSSAHNIRSKCPRIVITEEMRQTLIRERERTGATIRFRVRRDPNLPSGLTPALISNWLNGRIRSARPDHWEFVMSWWRSLPDALPGHAPKRRSDDRDGYAPIPETTLAALRAERTRTGIGPVRLFGRMKVRPDGLNDSMIRAWLAGQTKSARPEHVAFVLEAWRALPDRSRARRRSRHRQDNLL
jgi:hypothetical protein